MKQKTQNTFTNGMQMDLNVMTTPRNLLTDCLNGTLVTFNGNEFTLQNDMGNCKVETASLPPGYIPIGMREYGGIIYVAAYSPVDGMCQIGSFPSPQVDFSTNDFADLSPVEFKQTQFVLANNITQQSVTNIVAKLFEPELFELHPGDLYVITYKLNEPVGGTPNGSTTLDTEPVYEDYISDDPNNRKLFRLSFYQITNSNNLTLLDPSKVHVIEYHTPLLDGDYAYFTGNSKSAIAAGLAIETLDSFDANVNDTSLRTNADKQVTIEALGSSASLSAFIGVRVDTVLPSVETFYLEMQSGTNGKVSGIVDGLAANSQFSCTLTPYSQYCMFPDLKKSYSFTLGQYLTVGSGVNNLFRFYLDPTGFIQMDFDYRFQGNNEQGIFLYVEFYDPWSDYSIIKVVDSPTYYGINSVIMTVIDEPVIDQFDSTTVGGTDPALLITNADLFYQSTLLNSTNKIRTNQDLRSNHFYIVRVSGVDTSYDSGTGLYSYVHYDFYKGLYTTDMFNATYLAQGGLAPTSPNYVADFNTLNFDLTKVFYSSALTPTSSNVSTPVITQQRQDLITNGEYYAISAATKDTTVPYSYVTQYRTENDYSIELSLSGLNYIFGTFKTNLLEITPPTLQASNGTDPTAEKPTIVDAGYDSNPVTAPQSLADWLLATIDSTSYTLSSTLSTLRTVTAPVTQTTHTGYIYAEVPMLSSFYYRPNSDGPFSPNNQCPMLIQKYQCQLQREDGSVYVVSLGPGASPNDTTVIDMVTAALTTRKYSAIAMTSGEVDWGYGSSTPYNDCRNGAAAWKQCDMMIAVEGQTAYRLTETISIQAMVQFFSSLFIASNVSTSLYIYYPNTSGVNLSFNGNITTTATFPDLVFSTTFTPNMVSGSYVETYLSTFRMHATGALGDFSATTINSYIASRIGSSVILDGKQTVRDGFIPSIIAPSVSTDNLSVTPIVIMQSANNTIVGAMGDGINEFESDPALAAGPKPHGMLFTTSTEYYQNYVNMLQIQNVTPGVQVTSTGSGAAYVSVKPGVPFWTTGTFPKDGRCAADNVSPTLIPSFNIPTQ